MRPGNAIVKHSLGRVRLYHLRSPASIEVNDATLQAIEAEMCCPTGGDSDVAAFLTRLCALGLVGEGAFQPFSRRDGSELVTVEVEPTNRCNLKCRHCFVEQRGDRLSDEVFLAALEGAWALGAVEWTFNGGEPLAHPRCLRWIEQVCAAGLRCQLFTNATLIDTSAARRIADAGVALVRVSLDGLPAQHDAIRGAGAFDAAVRGIQRLVSEGVVCDTTAAVHPGNINIIPELRRFCVEELGVRRLRLTTVAPMGKAADAPELALDQAHFDAVYATPEPPARLPHPGLLPCAAGVDKLFVAANGDVYPCHLFERLGRAMGSLQTSRLTQIYDQANRDSVVTAPDGLLDTMRRFEPDSLTTCKACPQLPDCLGGCRARAWRLGGDPRAADPIACRRRLGRPPEKRP